MLACDVARMLIVLLYMAVRSRKSLWLLFFTVVLQYCVRGAMQHRCACTWCNDNVVCGTVSASTSRSDVDCVRVALAPGDRKRNDICILVCNDVLSVRDRRFGHIFEILEWIELRYEHVARSRW